MNTIRYYLATFIIISISTIITITVGSTEVGAVSPYDDIIRPKDTLTLRDVQNNSAYDLSDISINEVQETLNRMYQKCKDVPFFWLPGSCRDGLSSNLDYLNTVLGLDPSTEYGSSTYGNWMVLWYDYDGYGTFKICSSRNGATNLMFRQSTTSNRYQLVATNSYDSNSPSALGCSATFYVDSYFANNENPLGIQFSGYPGYQDQERWGSPPHYNADVLIITKERDGSVGQDQPYIVLSTYPVVYPVGYEGLPIRDASDVDKDGDGLNLLQEAKQGTSDNNLDSDNDGISDFKESIWFPDRDEVFCDTEVTPYVCAYPDPLVQDIYVEVDWMRDPSTNRVFKPTDTQVGIARTMFANEGINLHVDTGQFGGGNELASYMEYLPQDSMSGMTDYWDYKYGSDDAPRSFSANKIGVWRYLIYGYKYSTAEGNSISSGWSAVLGDSIFIAGGAIEDNSLNITDNDRRVSNTIAHEIGHSLCLSNTRFYIEQSAECVYAGIDNKSGDEPLNNPDPYYDLENYTSVMNYLYQFDLSSGAYSHGLHNTDDHDDWAAIKENMGGFSRSHTVYVGFGAENYARTPDGHIIVNEIEVDQISKDSDEATYVVGINTGPEEASDSSHQALSNSEVAAGGIKQPQKNEAMNGLYQVVALVAGVSTIVTTGLVAVIKKRG